MLRISIVHGRAASKRSRVLLGAIGILVALLMIAPSVSASEGRDMPATAAVTAAQAARTAEATFFPAFGLPFAPGQPSGSAGIHSDDGATGPKNAIDLTPDDGIVRAPLEGTVHVWQCSGGPWVTIDHQEGWRTGYYHLENIQVADGQQVAPGTVLGTIGNALPCGGASSGAHVHFTLWSLTASAAQEAADPAVAGDWDGVSYVELSTDVAAVIGEPVNGKVFGGWQLFEGAAQYSGQLVRQSDGWLVPLPGTFMYG